MKLEYTEAKGFNNMYASTLRAIVRTAIASINAEIKAFGNTSATFGGLVDSIKNEINATRRVNIMTLNIYTKIKTDRQTYVIFTHGITEEMICEIKLKTENEN